MKSFIRLCVLSFLLTACSPALATPAATAGPTEKPILTPTAAPATAMPTQNPPKGASPIYFIDPSFPGAEPQAFGADFFSGSFHSAPVFSPDMTTMWWAGSYGSATIYTSQFIAGAWSDPETVRFSESISNYRDPFISPDGQHFFFISPDPIPDIAHTGKENIWMMTSQSDGWSAPVPLPQSINALSLHWTISVNAANDLYFSAGEPGDKDIYFSRFINGAYTEPVPLPAPVNSSAFEITPNIASDGSYLLFSRYASQEDEPYLFISYATETGWTEPVRVENVPYCISPIVTPDGAYVIYLSSPSSFGWRDTAFIEEYRP
jgi:hypothetical protein